MQINGYFTVLNCPLIEVADININRCINYLDILAVKFVRQSEVHAFSRALYNAKRAPIAYIKDSLLHNPSHSNEIIIAELLQSGDSNKSMILDHKTLVAALDRFGCCKMKELHDIAHSLLISGSAETSNGFIIRMAYFSNSCSHNLKEWIFIDLEHVRLFVKDYCEYYKINQVQAG